MAKKKKLGSDPLGARRPRQADARGKTTGLDALIRETGSRHETGARTAYSMPQPPSPETPLHPAEAAEIPVVPEQGSISGEIPLQPVTSLEQKAVMAESSSAWTEKRPKKEAQPVSGAGQYLAFRLGKELFALEITHVREIVEFRGVTKVPNMPEYLFGVLNLRGGVLPVVDIKKKLGIESAKLSPDTCVIIVEPEIDGNKTKIGILADSVSEVIELPEGNIKPAPKIGMRLDTSMLRGIGVRDVEDAEFVLIFEIDRLFTHEEIAAAVDVSASPAHAMP